jgi:hypothetical protein
MPCANTTHFELWQAAWADPDQQHCKSAVNEQSQGAPGPGSWAGQRGSLGVGHVVDVRNQYLFQHLKVA